MTAPDDLRERLEALLRAIEYAIERGCVGWIEHGRTVREAAARLGECEWRDISEAPKDSKARLVWCPERMNIYCVCWGTYWNDRAEGKPQWVIFGAHNTPLVETPTHFMHLPSPPESTNDR